MPASHVDVVHLRKRVDVQVLYNCTRVESSAFTYHKSVPFMVHVSIVRHRDGQGALLRVVDARKRGNVICKTENCWREVRIGSAYNTNRLAPNARPPRE